MSWAPLQLGGVLKEWVLAPDLEPYRRVDGRQIVAWVIGTLDRYTVIDVAREDYLSSYEDKKAVPEILITHLMEGIGIALDVQGNQMFVTDFAGSVYSADLDGKNERNFLSRQGNLTGVAYAEI